MATARARRPGRARKVVNYNWSGLLIRTTTIPALTKTLLAFFFLDTVFEETIVRVRGMMYISADQVSIDEEQSGAFGMIRVTDRAIAAGASSIPGPVTDADDDGWFVWVPFAQLGRPTLGQDNSNIYEIDSKAQRIVREGQQLAVMIENNSLLGGLRVVVALRALSRFRS